MTAYKEIENGQRFAFGDNWSRYLKLLDEDRIIQAEQSLKAMLAVQNLEGVRFLDVGSGSGLFSLAARRLGATVHSFDFDPRSVACTSELKRLYFLDDPNWQVEEASVLDQVYLDRLGSFDVVYSWGVLHHTGAMWTALANVVPLVAKRGRLVLAVYNDQGRASAMWLHTKKTFNALPRAFRWLVLIPALIRLWGPTSVRDIVLGKPGHTWRNSEHTRGMDPWRDVCDWVGGLPFEVAKPEEIFDFFRAKGFELDRLKTCAGGHGCNEFAFTRVKI